MKKLLSLATCTIFIMLFSCSNPSSQTNIKINSHTGVSFSSTQGIKIGGLIGESIDSSEAGRLSQFINTSESEAIKIFASKYHESKGSWRGEHAGKWLYAASKAAYRSKNKTLNDNVLAVADFLIEQQNNKGYIGTYVDTARFYANPVQPRQTWDVWISSYLLQGFIEVYKNNKDEKYLTAAKKIANLMIETFMEGDKVLANSGCFSGMASNGVMADFVNLYQITKDPKHLAFAKHCAYDLENRPGTEIITRSLNKLDVAQIGEGKMYEMIRCYLGFAKYYQETKNDTFLMVALNAWDEIQERHLSPLGAPWGGIHQHKECFNIGYMFSPYGYSETCAMMDWFRLTKEMYLITGDIKYMNELEKTIYNGIPGAQFPDGLRWSYHSHPNGERHQTGEWACCSSSGTVVLEEIPEIIYGKMNNGIAINIFAPSETTIKTNSENIAVKQETNYPWSGDVYITINKENSAENHIYIRIPEWAKGAKITSNGNEIISNGNEYVKVSVTDTESRIIINLPMDWQVVEKTNEYQHKGYYIDGIEKFFHLKRGPVVYACNLEDQLENPTKLRFIPNEVLNNLTELNNDIPFYSYRDGELIFKPYFMACERTHLNYKSTWLKMP